MNKIVIQICQNPKTMRNIIKRVKLQEYKDEKKKSVFLKKFKPKVVPL